MESFIDRAAGDKTKGFRFQKLRACMRLLEKITASGTNRFSCAIEFLEDSFLIDESGSTTVAVEENKLYTSTLSFNSSPVKNTVVAFIDLCFLFASDSSLLLCFFASASVGNERPSKQVLEAAGVETGTNCSILKKLVNKEIFSDDEIKICHRLIIDEYASQYKGKEQGFLSILLTWTPQQTVDFISRIEWSVTSDGNEELEKKALEQVRLCHHFSSQHEYLEGFILPAILDLFEKLAEKDTGPARLVHSADVELIYIRVLGSRGQLKPADPAYKAWQAIETTDIRNLTEKIVAVTPDYLPSSLKKLARRCALAKFEGETFGKEYVSLRRRIFDVCETVLAEKIINNHPLTSAMINDILAEMTERSLKMLANISRSFQYMIDDEETVRNAILSLFDECYLAFDEVI